MRNKYSLLLKNIGLFTIGSIGSKIVTFLMVPLYTAILSTKEYGTVDLVSSTVQLLTPVLLLSIQDATLRFGMDPNYKKEDVLSTSLNIILKGTIVLFLGLFILQILKIVNLSFSYLVFLFISFVLGSVNTCFILYLKAKNNASVIAVSGILSTLAVCISNVFCLIVFRLGVNGYMFSYLLGLAIQVVYQFIFGKIYKEIRLKNYNDLSKQMMAYSSPLIANSISWWVNNASDRYILTWVSGVAVNGIYSISYKIPTILAVFQGIFYNAWSISAISEFDEVDNDGFIGNNYIAYSFISFSICSFLLLINIPIARIFYTGDFFIAWQCVPFLLVGTVFSGISQFEGALFAAKKKTKDVSFTTIIGATVNTICNLIFINLWGAIGAAISTMFGYFVIWVIRTLLIRGFVKMKVQWNIHIASLIFLIIQAFLATFNIFFIAQILLFLLIIFLHRRYFVHVLKNLRIVGK